MKRYLIAGCGVLLLLAIYAAAELVRVPDVDGTYQSASKQIEDAGLRVAAVDAAGLPREPHDLEIVVSQDPRAGSLRPTASTVTLRTRAPVDTVVVPDVVGQRLTDATKVIHDAGLGLDAGGPGFDDGSIASTIPTAGTVVPFGARVLYILSSGL